VTKKSEEIETELKRISEEQGKLKKDMDCASAFLSKSKADVEVKSSASVASIQKFEL
jgi:hypothetical protein